MAHTMPPDTASHCVQVQSNHQVLSEEFQLEKLRTENIETALKDMIKRLKQEIKEESRNKYTYEV